MIIVDNRDRLPATFNYHLFCHHTYSTSIINKIKTFHIRNDKGARFCRCLHAPTLQLPLKIRMT